MVFLSHRGSPVAGWILMDPKSTPPYGMHPGWCHGSDEKDGNWGNPHDESETSDSS
jgi:hypothetical protein